VTLRQVKKKQSCVAGPLPVQSMPDGFVSFQNLIATDGPPSRDRHGANSRTGSGPATTRIARLTISLRSLELELKLKPLFSLRDTRMAEAGVAND
jgi:hypothetical protein